MPDAVPPNFLDVPRLLEASLPKPRNVLANYAVLFFTVLVLTMAWAANSDPRIQSLGGLVIFGAVVASATFASRAARAQRAEQQRVEAIEELVQLRRWDHAAAMLDAMLGAPARSPAVRLQALIYLASVLARYHRFADAIAVQDYLLETARYDPGTSHGIRLMRAMAMLHEDHLVDADRAIADLRREAPESAGLALIEIYRDIRTGHPAEAIEIFKERLPAMRAQLGHRVGDAYALVAHAHDTLGESAAAAVAFDAATHLAAPDELVRRYPEIGAIRAKYPAAPNPAEAA